MGVDLYTVNEEIIDYGPFNFTFVRNEAQRGGAIFVDHKSSTSSDQKRITARVRNRDGFGLPRYENHRCPASIRQFAYSNKVR